MKSVIVVGGGFAGLSAATALAQKGHIVTLLEGRQILGGRAYSFVDPVTGDSVDNGQHLFMGCYEETLQFLKRIGSLGALTFQPSLSIRFAGDGNRRAMLRCLSLPTPWHLYSGLLRLTTLSWGDRWRLRHVYQELQKSVPVEDLDKVTVEDWLKEAGQSENARRHLWDLITIACLNEGPRIASAASFVAVLKRAFFGDAGASQLAFANVGLTDVYVPQAVRYIEAAGGCVRLGDPVHRLEIRQGRVEAVIFRNGERLAAESVIAAVPPWSLSKLLPPEWADGNPYFEKLNKLTYSPIISIHLWFDRAITPELFAGLLDTHIQWLFNRSRLHDDAKTKEGYVSLVISGAHDFVEWSDKKILSMALAELKRLFPGALEAILLRSLVIKENRATLSPKIGTESLRPAWESPIKNLWVAGDWTKTGLPATIESACLSGHRCAELIGRHCEEALLTSGPTKQSVGQIATGRQTPGDPRDDSKRSLSRA